MALIAAPPARPPPGIIPACGGICCACGAGGAGAALVCGDCDGVPSGALAAASGSSALVGMASPSAKGRELPLVLWTSAHSPCTLRSSRLRSGSSSATDPLIASSVDTVCHPPLDSVSVPSSSSSNRTISAPWSFTTT